jgi:endonuclease YncB( thermonuclease family)
VLRGIVGRIAALPLLAKILLAAARLIVLGLSVALSPLVVAVAVLSLVVAIFALLIQLLRRASLRSWGIVAATSLLFILVFAGISNALYGGVAQEPASSPNPTQQAKPTPFEETTDQPKTRSADQESSPKPEAKDDDEAGAESESRVKKEPPQEQVAVQVAEQPEDSLADLGKVVVVSRVVDGDTIEVSPTVGGIANVRLIGVDTPEIYGGTEPYGEEASAFTTERLESRKVALEFDVERIDPYGRALAYVWLPDGTIQINEQGLEVHATPPFRSATMGGSRYSAKSLCLTMIKVKSTPLL